MRRIRLRRSLIQGERRSLFWYNPPRTARSETVYILFQERKCCKREETVGRIYDAGNGVYSAHARRCLGGTNAGTTLSFKNLWDVQVASRKLYADENGQKTGEDLLKEQVLENVEGSNAKKYPAIFLEPGTYWPEGYNVGDAAKEIQPQLNGGITITVAGGRTSMR